MADHIRAEQVRLIDGRTLQFWSSGPPDALALVWHHGTPGSGLLGAHVRQAAQERQLRVVTYSRAGYGSSARHSRRTVADVADDIVAILDQLGVGEFLTAGVSGGGPHALACGARLGGRCRAVAVIAGVAPYERPSAEWTAGMAAENVAEFAAAMQGEMALRPFLAAEAETLTEVTGRQVVAALGGLLPPVDQGVLIGELAAELAASMRLGLCRGADGWLDDDLAFVRPWGFGLADVRVPVTLWQGGADRMVPAGHGSRQAEGLPAAHAHFLPEEGHLSITVSSIGAILDELIELGR